MSMNLDVTERVAKLPLPIDQRVSLLLGLFGDLEWEYESDIFWKLRDEKRMPTDEEFEIMLKQERENAERDIKEITGEP